jgi:beta-glucosidase
VHQVWRAVSYNWPIKGYLHWSLVDNFEWERGWSQRFGLWGLDLSSQARIRRPSVDLYAAICKENALSHAAVERYAPEALPHIYPS